MNALPASPHSLLRRVLLPVVLLGLLACHARQPESVVPARLRPPAPERALRQVRGSFVTFNISTFVSIPGAAFEQQFPDATPFLIQDAATLRVIGHRLAVLAPDTQGLQLDTRAKAVLFYTDRPQDTLCMGQFSCTYRGQRLRADATLYQLLGVGPEE